MPWFMAYCNSPPAGSPSCLPKMLPHAIALIPPAIFPQNKFAGSLDGRQFWARPTVPWVQLSSRPVESKSFGPLAGAATVPQISCRSFSSTPVDTYKMRQTRAPVGNPGLEAFAAVRSTADTRSPGPSPAGTGPPTPFGPTHGAVPATVVEVEPVAPDPDGVGLFAPSPPDEHDETKSTPTPTMTTHHDRRSGSRAAVTWSMLPLPENQPRCIAPSPRRPATPKRFHHNQTPRVSPLEWCNSF